MLTSPNTPVTAVAGCRRRFLPTLPRQVILLRSSSAGVCREPALLTTYLARMTSLKLGAAEGGGSQR